MHDTRRVTHPGDHGGRRRLPRVSAWTRTRRAKRSSTGCPDEMLAKIADFHDDETGRSVESLLAAFEPAMVTLPGIVVGGMIVSMYLPIFDMINVVR